MRQFVSSEHPDKNGQIRVSGREYRYLAQVLRLREGASLEVRFPSGELTLMVIEKIENRQLVLSLSRTTADTALKEERIRGVSAGQIQTNQISFPEIWLFQALPRAAKMDSIIRQAVEMGVSKIFPFKGDFSISSYGGENRLERWNRIAREARQQSGSPVTTEITESPKASTAVNFWLQNPLYANKSAMAFILREVPDTPLERKSLYGYLTCKPVLTALAVGPEGGFSQGEEHTFMDSGFLPLHFATNVLRVETAAVYGLAVLQNTLLEFDSWKRNV